MLSARNHLSLRGRKLVVTKHGDARIRLHLNETPIHQMAAPIFLQPPDDTSCLLLTVDRHHEICNLLHYKTTYCPIFKFFLVQSNFI